MSTFEEIRPELEIWSKAQSVDIHAFEGFYPLHHSGVASELANSLGSRILVCAAREAIKVLKPLPPFTHKPDFPIFRAPSDFGIEKLMPACGLNSFIFNETVAI